MPKPNTNLRRRHRRETLFKAFGLGAILIAVGFLVLLLTTVIGNGYGAFTQTYIKVTVPLTPQYIDPDSLRHGALHKMNFRSLLRQVMEGHFGNVEGRRDERALNQLFSVYAPTQLEKVILANPKSAGDLLHVWVLASDVVDQYAKGNLNLDLPPSQRALNDKQLDWLTMLTEQGRLERKFNWLFFQNADSREPELAGIWGALAGSAMTMLITLLLAFPFGVAAAIYLEEFAPKNRLTNIIEVNINNLAAVPSIVFGLLGLALFLHFFGMPRSAPLVGGCVLALMTLPTIIIATRTAIRSVPASIRQGAQALGASPVQVVFHHVLPNAMPGILTGTIIGMAQALGETAPLLMIGMVAFIADAPQSFTDPATVLPVQIFIWADSAERGFVEKTSAAIMVLLSFLVLMNLIAVILRKKLEKKW